MEPLKIPKFPQCSSNRFILGGGFHFWDGSGGSGVQLKASGIF